MNHSIPIPKIRNTRPLRTRDYSSIIMITIFHKDRKVNPTDKVMADLQFVLELFLHGDLDTLLFPIYDDDDSGNGTFLQPITDIKDLHN